MHLKAEHGLKGPHEGHFVISIHKAHSSALQKEVHEAVLLANDTEN